MEGVGNREADRDRGQGNDQPRAELVQMLHERRAFVMA
jgi:hypothetical protein